MEFAKFLRALFLQNTSGGCFSFCWREKSQFLTQVFVNTCFINTKHLRLKRLWLPRKNNNNTSQNGFTFSFKVSYFKLNTIRTQSNIFLRTRSGVNVHMKQLETGIIFVFMNIKRSKTSFLSIVLCTIIYEIKSLGSANLNTNFRFGCVTGNRGIFLWPNLVLNCIINYLVIRLTTHDFQCTSQKRKLKTVW